MKPWDGKVAAPNGSRHWLANKGATFVAVWDAPYADGSGLVWHVAGTVYSAAVARQAYRYLGPCLMPEDVAAALAAARREGAREMRERAATIMHPMLRSMLSRSAAAAAILALPDLPER